MNKPLAFAAVAEAATGAGLIALPSVVGRLLLGSEMPGVSGHVARLMGCALLALGLACWPGKSVARSMVIGMTVYSALVAAYLAFLGIGGEWVGPALWPAVGLHVVLTLWLLRSGSKGAT